jgi:hypothetical protein
VDSETGRAVSQFGFFRFESSKVSLSGVSSEAPRRKKEAEMSTQAVPQRRKSIEASPEDRVRLSRLYEEIAGRQAEMSLILARMLGWSLRTSKAFACALPAGFPWTAAAENKELRSLVSAKHFGAKEADGGEFVMPMITFIITDSGPIGVYD